MVSITFSRGATVLFWSAAVMWAAWVGVGLRLEDPLSHPALPAEDTFNHMALVREHLRDGSLDPLNPGGRLYPPGMHAFLAAAWAYTGSDLYEIMRMGPVVLGAIGVLGIAVLLWRLEGPVAAFVGALAMAAAPEAVLRTSMMAPTALDLAVLPFFLYAVVEAAKGRLAWAGVAAVLALFLVFSHPWLLTVLAFAGALFLVLSLAFPWSPRRRPPLRSKGLALAVLVTGLGWALALTGCGGTCGPGFREIVTEGERYGSFAPYLALATVAVGAALWWAPPWLDKYLKRDRSPSGSWRSRLLVSAALLIGLGALSLPVFTDDLPQFVDLDRMFGWPTLVLAAGAVVALPFLRGPAAYLGASIALTTYPFVIYNPLDSPFWPHRTAVYLGVGLFLLAGVAAAGLARLAWWAFAVRAPSVRPARRFGRPRPALALVPALLVAGSFAVTVEAVSPGGHTERWYRLYPACDNALLEKVADAASPQETAVLITGSWQSKLILAAYTSDASRVWYWTDFFLSSGQRDGYVSQAQREGRPLYVIVDDYLNKSQPKADTSFLTKSPWRPLDAECRDYDPSPSVRAYVLGGSPA